MRSSAPQNPSGELEIEEWECYTQESFCVTDMWTPHILFSESRGETSPFPPEKVTRVHPVPTMHRSCRLIINFFKINI